MKLLLITSFLITTQLSWAQSDTTLYGWVDSLTYRQPEITSACVGGTITWNLYLAKTLKYPKEAKKKRIQGTVIIEFTISADRNISDVKVFKSIEKSLDEEAIRLIENCRWAPAIQNGKDVNYRARQEIEFHIN